MPEGIKSCLGCKHHLRVFDRCLYGRTMVSQENLYSGKVTYTSSDGNILAPLIGEVRSETGKCGPERKLYERSFWYYFVELPFFVMLGATVFAGCGWVGIKALTALYELLR